MLEYKVLTSNVSSAVTKMFKALPGAAFDRGITLVPLAHGTDHDITVATNIVVIVLKLLPGFTTIVGSVPPYMLNNTNVIVFKAVTTSKVGVLDHIRVGGQGLLVVTASVNLKLNMAFHPSFITGLPRAVELVFSSNVSANAVITLVLGVVLGRSGGRIWSTRTRERGS